MKLSLEKVNSLLQNRGLLLHKEPGSGRLVLDEIGELSKESSELVQGGPGHRNPFSDAASRALRVILSEGKGPWLVKELAQKGGISAALVSYLCNRLEELAIISKDEPGSKIFLKDPERLLEAWVGWYALKPMEMRRYAVPLSQDPESIFSFLKKHNPPEKWGLSFLAGASFAAPHASFREVHVICDAPEEKVQEWVNKNGLVQSKDQGQLYLVRPYYKKSWHMGVRKVEGLNVVSDVQLVLDCSRFAVRGDEQSDHLIQQIRSKLAHGV